MQITAIPLDKVEYDSDQPRRNKPQIDVNALANSIALKGLLNPIHARYALPFSLSIFG
jgi:ParB-like chromosome segregation protein Spo0J